MTRGGDELGFKAAPAPYTEHPLLRSSGGVFNATGFDGPGCSAAAMRSASQLLVLTAAHCVPGRDLDTNPAFFRPAFSKWATTKTPWSDEPEAPYGDWSITDIFAPTRAEAKKWGETGGDLAILKVAPREVEGAPTTLTETVDGYTPVLDPMLGTQFHFLGYPATAGYNNREMFQCLGRTQPKRDKNEGPFLQTDNCHGVGGNSGGPWVMARHRGGYGLIGTFSAAGEPYDRTGSSTAAPTLGKTFGTLLRRADPEGVKAGQYDDMEINTKDSNAVPVRPKRGGPVTYTFLVQLSGHAAHANVPVTIDLSKGQRFVKATYSTCKTDRSPRRVRCRIPMLWTGEDMPVRIHVATSKSAPKRLAATATAHSSLLDQNKKDNRHTLVVGKPKRTG